MPKREPLYPHVPKSKQPQSPHMKGRQPSTMEGGELVSPEYRHLTSLVDEPLPKDAF